MALPKGWTETKNEWRRRLQDPALFSRIRPKRLEGIGGVYIVGGPMRGQGPAFVPQAIRFEKSEWPSLTAAVGWYEASRFSVRAENPPLRRTLSVPEKHQLKIARQTLRLSDAGARIMGGMTKDEARAIIARLTGRAENPPAAPFVVTTVRDGTRFFISQDPAETATDIPDRAQRYKRKADAIAAAKRARSEFRWPGWAVGRGWGSTRSNPPLKPYRGWKIDAERFQQPDGNQLWGITATKGADRVNTAFVGGPSMFATDEARSVAMAAIAAHEKARRTNPPSAPSPIIGKVGFYMIAITEQARLWMKAAKKVFDAHQAGRKPTVKQWLDLESYQERVYRLALTMGNEGAPAELPPYELTRRLDNPGIVDAIRAGDRVTIVDRFGQRHTGRAVMRSSSGGWVLNMGGKHGTPGLADESNIVKVSPRKARENPPLEPDPNAEIKWHEAPSTLAYLARSRVNYEGGRFLIPAILNDLSQEERDRISEYLVRIRHPLAFEAGRQDDRIAAAARELASRPGGEVTSGTGRYFTPGAERQRVLREMSGWPKRRDNPSRLEAFRKGAGDAIERLSEVEAKLSAATARAFEDAEIGKVEKALRDEVRSLQLEQRALVERVRSAVARHAAALGEFSIDPADYLPAQELGLEEIDPDPRPRSRRSLRDNPSTSERKEAVARFEQFHGTKPRNFSFREIPDLTKLVTLGRALEVHYQAHVPRGSRNTPYRHEFGPDATLLTDSTGKALVILGNLSVGRAPRGRLGYIRG